MLKTLCLSSNIKQMDMTREEALNDGILESLKLLEYEH